MSPEPGAGTAVVVGLGSPDRGDDAVGPVVARRVAALGLPGVRVVQLADPTRLIELWCEDQDATGPWVVVDAVRSGRAPGALVVLETGSTRPRLPGQVWAGAGWAGTHTFGLAESVELARALGRLPDRLVLVVVEAVRFGHGDELCAPVASAVGPAVEAVRRAVRAGPAPLTAVPAPRSRPARLR